MIQDHRLTERLPAAWVWSLLSALRRLPAPIWQTAGVAVVAVIIDAIWIASNHASPQWDQAHYLDLTLHYLQAVLSGGPVALARSVYQLDPGQAPLFPLLSVPFYGLADRGLEGPLLLNLAELPVLLFSTGYIASRLGGERARIPAVVAVATTPLLVGLLHQQLQDFTLVVVATLEIALLLRADSFRSVRTSLAFGLVGGVGVLVKVTFPIFVVGPLAVVILQIAAGWTDLRGGPVTPGGPEWRQVRNSAAAGAIAVALGSVWYVPQWLPTLAYVRSATTGALAIGTGPSHPATWTNVARFTLGLVNGDLSWGLALVLIAGLALGVPALAGVVRSWRGVRRVAGTGLFVLAWVGVPFASVALGRNQDVRLMAAAFPGIAVAIGVAVSTISPRLVRRTLVAATVAVGVAQTVVLTWPLGLPSPIGVIAVGTPVGTAAVDLSGQPVGYESLPETVDYGRRLIIQVERACAQVVPRGSVCVVGVLESDAVVNGNTLQYFADVRGDHIVFPTVSASPGHMAALLNTLRGTPVALYMPPPPASVVGTRVALLDTGYADAFMTPAAFALFRGPRRWIGVGRGLAVELLSR